MCEYQSGTLSPDVAENSIQGLYLGCASTEPDNTTVYSNDQLGVNVCRHKCATGGWEIAVFPPGSGCRCMAASSLGDTAFESSCDPSGEQWHVYWATHYVTDVTYPIRMTVDVRRPTDKPYIRPNETVTFSLKTESDEFVTFYVDFNDGIKVVTSHGVVSHAWQREDTYHVNITAVSRVTKEEQKSVVDVVWVEEGIAPEMVAVQGNLLSESREVNIYLTAVGVYAKTCILHLGDDLAEQFSEKQMMIYEGEYDHTYPEIGFYNVSLSCKNDYGATADSCLVLASHPVIEYESQARHTDVRIPVIGADANNVVVKVNGVRTNVTSDASGITIAGSEFTYSGEFVVRVEAAGGQALLTKVFNLQEVVGALSIAPTPRETRVNSSIHLDFGIDAGDHVHVQIDYGDGTVEYLYFVNETMPLRFGRNKTYAQLGTYYVIVSAANDVSFRSHREIVSIERDLQTAVMTARGVKNLYDAVVFTFEVDMNETTAMPFDVFLAYDTVTNETVQLGSKRPVATPVEYRTVFADYGKYLVIATVRNNISWVSAETRVQVGEDITFVDVYSDSDHVRVDENVTFTVHCPRGLPIHLEIDTGDNNVIVINRPEIIETTRVAATTAAVTTGDDDSDNTEATTESVLDDVTGDNLPGANRRKRDVGAASFNDTDSSGTSLADIEPTVAGNEDLVTVANDVPPPEVKQPDVIDSGAVGKPTAAPNKSIDTPWTPPPPNLDFTVRYTYRVPGHYDIKVKVSNRYTTRVSHLCQQIVVVPKDHVEITCPGLSMSLVGQYR